MLLSVLQIDGFYFSNTYDLTVSQQKIADFGPEYKKLNQFERVWHMSNRFIMCPIRRINSFCGTEVIWLTGLIY